MVTKKTGFDMDDVQVKGQGDIRKPSDVVDLYDLPDKKFVKLRPFGSVHAYGGHWIETKKKDGGKGNFYYPCAAFDIETGRLDSTKHCSWCDDESGHVRFATDYFMNAIHRKEQMNAPARVKATAGEQESGYKEKSSESWTPVKAVRLTGSVLRRLQDLKQLNTVEGEDGETVNYSVAHPRHGADVSIKRDKSVAPAQMYEVQMGTQAPLTKAERSYLIWDLSALMITPTQKETEAEYAKWAQRMGFISSKSSVAAKGKKPVVDEDEDDEDEDEAPKAKAKPTTSSKKKPVVDEDDDFDDEEDEEEAPPPKKKPAAKKKVVVEEDDDFDDEDDEPVVKKKPASKKPVVDEDEDEEDEAPPPKKKPSAVSKKKPVVDEDEDDDFDDEDEDEAPPPKKKPAAKKKVVVEEDDEDEEEAPPPKKKPAVAAKKPVTKKKIVDEDDEDDDIPF